MSRSVKELLSGGGIYKVGLLLGLGLLLVFFGISGGGESEGTPVGAVSEEERIAELCSSLSGVGDCRAVIHYRTESAGYGKEDRTVIEGIAVVCEGGESDEVKKRVTSLLSSLYGIGSNRITVEKMKK